MKKPALMLLFLGILLISQNAFAQQRTKILDGVYVVDYGGTYVIEDDINQYSISIKIAQERIDERNNELLFRVICGNTVERFVKKELLQRTIEAVITTYSAGTAFTLAPAIGSLSSFIYDSACDYWERKIREQ